MSRHVCPWWGGYFIDNRLRRLLHNPEKIIGPYVEAGMRVLDFGCGMGLFSIAMARLMGETGHVISVDVQQKMLDVLVQRATRAGVAARIRPHRCEPDALGLDESVDFALAFYSAHETPDHRRLIKELHSTIRPAGSFLLVEPVGHVSSTRFREMVEYGEEIGFQVNGRPHVRLSRAVVLTRC